MIDTAFGLSLALAHAGHLRRRTSRSQRRRTDPLYLISELLRVQNLSLSDVTHLAVRIGIGSYTGLRIGVTLANFLAWSLDRPLAGFEDARSRLLRPAELLAHLRSIEWSDRNSPDRWTIPKYGQWSRPKFSDILK